MKLIPIVGDVKKVMPHLVRPNILHLASHSTLAGHPGEHHMYDKLRREYFRPDMSTDMYTTVLHCEE